MIEAQIRRVREELSTRPAGLIRHTERVLVEALDFAACYDQDPMRVELGVVGHDLFRAAPGEELLARSRAAGLDVTAEDKASPVLLHGALAADLLAKEFGVEDGDVLAAIRDHTLGLARMSMLAKIILLADKVEAKKRRGDSELKAIRKAARRDLDVALLSWADRKWYIERRDGWPSDSRHWQARIAWVSAHHSRIRRAADSA